jgi:uncharacterized protein YdeI (BOF family)
MKPQAFFLIVGLTLLILPVLFIQNLLKANPVFAINNSAIPISCGQTLSGNITSPTQRDTYIFDGNAGEAVAVSAFGTSGAICVRAELYSPTDTLIGYNGCNSSTGSVSLPANGTYTIRVYNLSTSGTGTYGVNLQFVTGRCGTPIACGETKNGKITNKAQRDTYSFTGDIGEAVVISAVSTSDTICAWAELYSPAGKLIDDTYICNSNSVSLPLSATGTYTILVYDFANKDSGAYGVNLQFVTGRCGTSIACGETKSKNITNKAQQDTYSFTGNTGEAVVVSVVGTLETICAWAELYSPAGKLIGDTFICDHSSPNLALPATGTYTILVYDRAYNDNGAYQVHLSCPTTSVNSPNIEKSPSVYDLGQNYPNPFNPSTTITFALPRSSHVILKVFDLMGKEITILVDKKLVAGRYEVLWDGRGVESGVYFYQLQAGEFLSTKKLTLLR